MSTQAAMRMDPVQREQAQLFQVGGRAIKHIRIEMLRIKNFKGLAAFKVEMDGSLSIHGDNATGKTTLFDAFSWLLFGKDSLNSAVFEIKALDKNGEAVHGLEHLVEAILNVDGKPMALKKVYSEKWTKKRGEALKTFTGHTVDHFVEGVPVKKKEFDEAVFSLCSEDIFRLLTNPRHFNEVLHWTDRRALLLQVCGDITDADVIASSDDLRELPTILGKRKIEDHKKVIAARRTEINRELDRIPVRIDEIEATRRDVSRETDEIEKELKRLQAEKHKLEKDLAAVTTGGEVALKENELKKLELKILEYENQKIKEERKRDEARYARDWRLKHAAADIGNELADAQSRHQGLLDRRAGLKSEIEQIDTALEDLRSRWHTENDRPFEKPATDAVCPACGQEIPEDRIKETHQKALENFNAQKARILAEIQAQGKDLSARKSRLVVDTDNLSRQIEEAQRLVSSLGRKHRAAIAEYDKAGG